MGQDLPQVVSCGAEDSILAATGHALQPVPPKTATYPPVTDFRLDCGSALHLLLDRLGDALSANGNDHPTTIGVNTGVLVAAVHMAPIRHCACEFHDLLSLLLQDVVVTRVAWGGLRSERESAALRRCQAGNHSELAERVGLPFAINSTSGAFCEYNLPLVIFAWVSFRLARIRVPLCFSQPSSLIFRSRSGAPDRRNRSTSSAPWLQA